MNTSADAPFLDCAYKLQEYEGRPRRKRSEGKATWPGRKQVYRQCDDRGTPKGDLLTLDQDTAPGTPLLRPVVRGGLVLGARTTLVKAREHTHTELAQLPERLRALDAAPPYVVTVSPRLRELAADVDVVT
jgi:nicotinate phosphoribosyltransferase